MIPAWMTRQIAEAQQNVLDRLTADAEYARRSSLLDTYSKIGSWLSDGGGSTALELGCGPGKFVLMLAHSGFRVTGVDPLRFPSWEEISELPHIEFLEGIKAESLPFEDGSFDAGACMGALLYFDSVEIGLNEFHRVLKPGARAILRTVNRENRYTMRTGDRLDPASKHLFTMNELVELVSRHGFQVEANFAYGFFPARLTNFWWFLANVVLSERTLDSLSARTPPAHRVNNTLFLTRI